MKIEETLRVSEPLSNQLRETSLKPGIGICLSGGGYRAMLFHVGSLWRLNEVGLLNIADRISSVSGGSITAGCLALALRKNDWLRASTIPPDQFRAEFVNRVCRFASKTIDWKCVLLGMIPGQSPGNWVANFYDRILFHGATLQDLPDLPRFVFNASNLQSGAVWRFSKPYMEDYKVAYYPAPQVPLSLAVAASSAFPPFLSPVRLNLPRGDARLRRDEAQPRELFSPPYTTNPILSDGGVYDNMALETVFKRFETVFVSDAGAPFRTQEKVSGFWPTHLLRVTGCIDNQVRARRKVEVVGALQRGERRGAYWGIGRPSSAYQRPPRLNFDESAFALAKTPTRLAALSPRHQELIINWGYASCAASLDANYAMLEPAPVWPFPESIP